MQSQVEELPENHVRLTVQVPSHDVHHAVEHAADDLAQSVKIPGFRKGKVPSSGKWMYAIRVPSAVNEGELADSSGWLSRRGSAPSASTSTS